MIGKLVARRREAAKARHKEAEDRAFARSMASAREEQERRMVREARASSRIARKAVRGGAAPLPVVSSSTQTSGLTSFAGGSHRASRKHPLPTATSQLLDLAAYIDRSRPGQDMSEVLMDGSLGFVAEERQAQIAEMAVTASEARRSKFPIEHVVLAWREGEQPDRGQLEAAIHITLDELGLRRHQVLWALHDGACQHLHLVINRVEPGADRPTKMAFPFRALGRAVARIEHRQGWEPAENARFVVVETGHVIERPSIEEGRNGRGRGSGSRAVQPDRAAEQRTTPTRDDREGDGGSNQSRRSDRDDHRSARDGNGRDGSSGGDDGIAPRDRGEAGPDARAATARAAVERALNDSPPARMARLRAEVRGRGAFQALPEGAELASVFGNLPILSEAAQAIEVRQGVRSAERTVIEEGAPVIDRAVDWASLHAGLAKIGLRYEPKGSGAIIRVGDQTVKASVHRSAAWRSMERRFGPFVPPSRDLVVEERGIEAAPGISPELWIHVVAARRAAAVAQRHHDSATAGVERGSIQASALSRLRPSAPPSARAIAAALGLDPPSHSPLALPPPPPHDPATPLGQLHHCLGADRYVVTAKGRRADIQGLLVSRPRPIDGLAADLDIIAGLDARGASISLSATSDREHLFVIADLDRAALARLKADGHRPRAVIATAEDSYQVVLATPRLVEGETSAGHLTLAEMAVARLLARRYSRTPDRAGRVVAFPGLRRWTGGKAFQIHLVEGAPGQVCGKAAELLGEAVASPVRQPATPLLPARATLFDDAADVRQRAHIAIYEAHRADLHRLTATRPGRVPNASTRDAQIAQRLRATGHGVREIAEIVTVGSRGIDLSRRLDWNRYGKNAAEFAFSPMSNKALTRLDRYVDAWCRIEGLALRNGEPAEEPSVKAPIPAPSRPLPPPLSNVSARKPSRRPRVRSTRRSDFDPGR